MDEGRVSHQIRQDYELRTLASDLETSVESNVGHFLLEYKTRSLDTVVLD